MREGLALPPCSSPGRGGAEAHGRRGDFVRLIRLLIIPGLLLPHSTPGQRIRFVDVAEEKGITFVHENGASGRKFTIAPSRGGRLRM